MESFSLNIEGLDSIPVEAPRTTNNASIPYIDKNLTNKQKWLLKRKMKKEGHFRNKDQPELEQPQKPQNSQHEQGEPPFHARDVQGGLDRGGLSRHKFASSHERNTYQAKESEPYPTANKESRPLKAPRSTRIWNAPDSSVEIKRSDVQGVVDFMNEDHAEIEIPEDHALEEKSKETSQDQQNPFVNTLTTLGLNSSLAKHIALRMGLDYLTPIQDQCLSAYMKAIQANSTRLFRQRIDLLLRSETGSGKTLAYLLPIAESLLVRKKRVDREHGSFAVIVAPTRELAVQVETVAKKLFNPWHWIVVGSVMGGEKKKSEKARIRKGLSVLVATPGRLLDHIRSTANFKLNHVEFLVLDEADRLLDLGFENDIRDIVKHINRMELGDEHLTATSCRSNFLVSATLTEQTKRLVDDILNDPVVVTAERKAGDKEKEKDKGKEKAVVEIIGDKNMHQNHANVNSNADAYVNEDEDGAPEPNADTKHVTEKLDAPETLRQHFCLVDAKLRLVTLIAFLRLRSRRESAKSIVFFSSCDSVDFHYDLFQTIPLPKLLQSTDDLRDGTKEASKKEGRPISLEESLCGVQLFRIHGNMSQIDRMASFKSFRSAKRGILLCTDIASRGLDLPLVSLSLQYDPPTHDEDTEYIHRVGRTARIGSSGDALLFLLPSESKYIEILEKRGMELKEVSADAALAALLIHKPEYAHAKLSRLVRLVTARLQTTIQNSIDGSSDKKHGLKSDEESDDENKKVPEERSEQYFTLSLDQRQHLQNLAIFAFRAYCRAYATHSKATRHIFNIKNLHLGHLARSFGLNRSPTDLHKLLYSGAIRDKGLQRAAERDQKASDHARASMTNPQHKRRANSASDGTPKRRRIYNAFSEFDA